MSKGRKLTRGENALWNKVAKTARPMPGRMESLLGSSADLAPKVPENSVQPPEPAKVTEGMRKALAASFRESPVEETRKAKQPAASLHPIERPVHRKIARGRLPIDATIDLHGLDQSAAHMKLLGFLGRAYADGLRHVLVITGKGASFGSEGALKRAVPHWLTQPDFRPYVSGYEQAARGHGGEGAIYLRLKKRRPAP
jgi:DNA-nicking Smr family endonuclease